MPLLTVVIDDKSPLITYDDTWLPGTSLDDGLAVDYYLGTFQKNNVTGTATFSFNGTAFWIYGANRANHGTFSVQVDSNTVPGINGNGNSFQQVLYTTAVNQGLHNVSLTNTGSSNTPYVDIDMIVWQSQVGNPGDQLVQEIVQNTDSRFEYQSGWETTSGTANINLYLFNNGSGHTTATSNAAVSFTFEVCEAVTLFGTSGPSNGLYSARLDGGQSVQYNATNQYPTNYGVTIYHADNLGPGSHQLVLTNLASGQFLTIDYAQLWTVANSSSNTTCPPISDNFASSNKLGSGAIAGLVAAVAVAVLAAAAALLFYRRWRAALSNLSAPYTPLYRSPGPTTTTATGIGIAPSLDNGSNSNSFRGNTFQPMVNHGASSSIDSRVVPEGTTPSSALLNGGQSLARRPLPEERLQPADTSNVTRSTGSEGWSALEGTNSLPPNYDTVVRNAGA